MATNPTSLTPKTKNKITSLAVMITFATFLGLIAAFGIWQYLNKTQEHVKQLTATRPVVVAKKQIIAGTKLAESDLTTKEFPVQAIPKDYPSSIETVKDRIVKTTLQSDEIITEARLVGQGAAGGLPLVIPPGQRAITIKVNEVVGVGGFINPGDRIDIVSIFKKNENQTFSKTILQNVLVLAVGDKILDPNAFSDPQAKVVGQLTLALSPIDSEKLALASEVGQLYLSLRPHGEDNHSLTFGAQLGDVYGDLAYMPPPSTNELPQPAVPANSNVVKNAVEIISGNQRSYFYY